MKIPVSSATSWLSERARLKLIIVWSSCLITSVIAAFSIELGGSPRGIMPVAVIVMLCLIVVMGAIALLRERRRVSIVRQSRYLNALMVYRNELREGNLKDPSLRFVLDYPEPRLRRLLVDIYRVPDGYAEKILVRSLVMLLYRRSKEPPKEPPNNTSEWIMRQWLTQDWLMRHILRHCRMYHSAKRKNKFLARLIERLPFNVRKLLKLKGERVIVRDMIAISEYTIGKGDHFS